VTDLVEGSAASSSGAEERAGVLIVDDHRLLAQSLAVALRAAGFEADAAPDHAPALVLDLVRTAPPAALVLDLHLGDLGAGDSIIGEVVDAGVDVVILTAEEDPVRLAGCLAAGASRIVSKTLDLDVLVDQLAEALEASLERWTARELRIAADAARREEAERQRLAPFASLTAREADVLAGLMSGLAAGEIAERSFVSLSTVRSQIRAVLAKLGVHSQLAAVAMAHQSHWTPPAANL
jgi:DNA-binding NarL/FixJ family response regulator